MNDKLNFELGPDEVNKILRALGQMPYAEVAELINTIVGQVRAQREPEQLHAVEAEK